MQRAFGNFRETFVYFAVAVLVVTALNKTNADTALGAQIYFWARAALCADLCRRHPGRCAPWSGPRPIVGLVMVLARRAGLGASSA